MIPLSSLKFPALLFLLVAFPALSRAQETQSQNIADMIAALKRKEDSLQQLELQCVALQQAAVALRKAGASPEIQGALQQVTDQKKKELLVVKAHYEKLVDEVQTIDVPAPK